MSYIVKQGRSVIWGDSDGLHHRFKGGEVVEGAERGDLDHCAAVEWVDEKVVAALAEVAAEKQLTKKELLARCDELEVTGVSKRTSNDGLKAAIAAREAELAKFEEDEEGDEDDDESGAEGGE